MNGYNSLEFSQKSSPNYFYEVKLLIMTGSLLLISPTSFGFSNINKNV